MVAPATSAEVDLLFDELAEALAPQLLVVRVLGRGGMGLVYLARDPALKRLVAVKVLSPALALDPTARARFAREAETMAAMSHPHIVSVYQVGELPRTGTSYLVMAYVSGGALREEFPEGTPAPEARARRCVGEIASALAAAHRMGVVHRDIKPSNVMLDRESNRYLVLDFGISAVASSAERAWQGGASLTSEGATLGTPQYMSPEQASGPDVTGKSDVYSLGCLAYELLTGEPPFTGSSPIAVIASHLIGQPARVISKRPELDHQFADLIDRCLAKQPEARPSADEITRVLLPSLKAVVEWPPPGLEPLRGLGTQWIRAAAIVAAAGIAFFTELMIQPTVSRACCWASGESSRLWSILKHLSYATPIRFDDPDAMSVWYFLLDATFILLLFSIPLVLVRSWRLVRRLREGRRTGYPWPTLLDVAWDHHPDTAELLNGTSNFTLLRDRDRERFLSLRRWASSLMAGAVFLAITTPTLWLYAGARLRWNSNGPIIGAVDAIALWLPALLTLLAAIATKVPEWRRRAEMKRQQTSGGRTTLPEVRRELVAVWLHSAGRTSPAVRWVPPSWMLVTVPVALLLALITTTSLLLSVVFTSTVRMVASGAEARSWMAASNPSDSVALRLPSKRGALGLMAAPSNAVGAQLVVDRALPAAVRLMLANAGEPAYCLSAREVLFGPSKHRSRLSLQDIADGARKAETTGKRSSEGSLSNLDSTTDTGRSPGGWRARMLGLLGLGDLSRRSGYCTEALGTRVSTVDSLPGDKGTPPVR